MRAKRTGSRRMSNILEWHVHMPLHVETWRQKESGEWSASAEYSSGNGTRYPFCSVDGLATKQDSLDMLKEELMMRGFSVSGEGIDGR